MPGAAEVSDWSLHGIKDFFGSISKAQKSLENKLYHSEKKYKTLEKQELNSNLEVKESDERKVRNQADALARLQKSSEINSQQRESSVLQGGSDGEGDEEAEEDGESADAEDEDEISDNDGSLALRAQLQALKMEHDASTMSNIQLKHQALRTFVFGESLQNDRFMSNLAVDLQKVNETHLSPNEYLHPSSVKPAVLLANYMPYKSYHPSRAMGIQALIVMYNDINQDSLAHEECDRLAESHMRFMIPRLAEFSSQDWSSWEVSYVHGYFDALIYKVLLPKQISGFT